ncbi:putative late blight resistance protein homolog R1A-10 [Salvia miltiorrhiza]|uniref:putative late blight resistance protein homolog R1A-10 n=1 Tax=Salvia miltiorrhiza TaxID=226208 RepID=UPI0025AC0174|nr:putative late blight resistance protein homolog R1A-10 [Salvia miltiorrhiza]
MAAYASVISLKHTIKRLLNSSEILLLPPSPEIIESASNELQSLRKTLIRLDRGSKSSSRKKINALDEQIREAVCKLEDLLESHLSNQILSQSEEEITEDGIQFSIDLQESEHEILCLVEALKEMELDYIKELDNPEVEEEEDDDGDELVVSTRIDSCGNESKMIGLSDKFLEIKDRLKRVDGLHLVTPITGMAGIGKTTLANEIFCDLDISEQFDLRAWVAVSRKWQLKEILLAILAQVDADMVEMIMDEEVKNIGDYLKESLKGKRHLIVLDDVWDKQVWDELKNSLFKDDNNGGKILITTRLDQVGRGASNPVSGIVKMRLLNKEESWDLLREKVFGEELCPYQLEKIGMKIAEKCEGLPLMIVAVANLLRGEERNPEYWNDVVEKKNSVFMDAYGAISKVLYPSFEYLAQVLRPCFLYMGVFPQGYEILKSKVVIMWAAEGFPEPLGWQTANDYSEQCLRALIYNNLVLLRNGSTTWNFTSSGVKSCLVHTSVWHVCRREAKRNKFFHILDKCGDDLEDGIEGQRRLSIHNNILFGIKDVHNLIEDSCASTARSLLCFGPYCRYQVPVCFGLRMLRVLDALTIRFYEFPIEVVKLVQLRYLGLTCDGNLPSSISKLWNLQFLIVFRHLSIKPFEAPSYMPMEIWDMKELKHLQIMGSDLRDPCGASLPNLSTLLDVSALSCREAVFEAIPNLRKLGVQIESEPDAAEPLSFLDRISNLKKLQILKCVVVNPDIMSALLLPPDPLPTSLSVLKKLHLGGLGYSWEHMSVIGSLPNLEVLKLRCYAFQGPTWIIEEKRFPKLGYLVIEDTDLVQWEVREGGCPKLYSLSIKHCHLLEEIHGRFGHNIGKIEVVDSNPSVETCLKQIINAYYSQLEFYDPSICFHYSWVDKKLKS